MALIMTRDEFWRIIDQCRVEDQDESIEALTEHLSKLKPDAISAFDRHLDELMDQSYTWELWGAAYLINGGCSDDGFDYFRGWLILQGKTVYDNALKRPDSLADLDHMEDVECEEIAYIASRVYESVTGKDLVRSRTSRPELGDGWDFDDEDEMRSRYPHLFAAYSDE
jgi:Protein of unknown function (DUF4240)